MGSQLHTARQISPLVLTPPDITTMKVASLLVLVIIHLAHSAPAAILERELKISGSIIDNKSEIGDTSGTSASSGRSRYYTSDPCTDNNCQTTVPTSKTVDHGDVENRDMCGYISCKASVLLKFALVASFFYFQVKQDVHEPGAQERRPAYQHHHPHLVIRVS